MSVGRHLLFFIIFVERKHNVSFYAADYEEISDCPLFTNNCHSLLQRQNFPFRKYDYTEDGFYKGGRK